MSSIPPQQPQPSQSGPGGQGPVNAGVLKTLFDFNFDSFITPKIVKAVYVIATALIVLVTLGMIITAFAMMTDGGAAVGLGFLFLLAAPIIGLVYLAFVRMSLELYYAVIRLSEDVHHGRGRL